MPVFRTEKTSDYAVIAKHHLKNRALSYKAKGLMTFMLSVPPDWDWSLAGLSTLANDGVDGVRSGIRELEKHGYLTRRRIRDAAGKLGDIEYTIHEVPKPPLIPVDDGCDNKSNALSKKLPPVPNIPMPIEPALQLPAQANPMLDSPVLENPTLVKPVLDLPTLDFPTLDKPTQALPAQDLPTQENPMQCINNQLSIESALSINGLNNKKHNAAPAADVCASDSGQLTLDDTAYPHSTQPPHPNQHPYTNQQSHSNQNPHQHHHPQQAECLTVQEAQGADKSANHTMTLVENKNKHNCEPDRQFDLFWQLYPRKAGKKATRKAWSDIKPDDVLFSSIMVALNAAVQYWQHQGISLKHIPHPSTWLNEERWDDEFPTAQPLGVDGGSHAVKYLAKHTTKQGGEQLATSDEDYTIGGDNDPYRGLMP